MAKKELNINWKDYCCKTLAISSLVHIFAALPNPPKPFLKELNNIIFKFLWNDKNDKIKRTTITRDYCQGGLRMIELESFIYSLKLSSLKRFLKNSANFNNIFPLRCLLSLGSNAADCLSHTDNPFWRDTLIAWKTFYRKHNFDHEDINQIIAQPLWLNHHFKSSYIIKDWFEQGIISIKDICGENGFLSFDEIQKLYKIKGTYLDYHRLLHNIPNNWKQLLRNNSHPLYQMNINSIVFTMISKDTSSRSFYDILINNDSMPMVLEHWNTIFDQEIDWNDVFIRYKKCTSDCKLLDFQYRFINRAIYTKKELLKMKLVDDDLCFFCKTDSENILHVFYECPTVLNFWEEVENFINNCYHSNHKLTKYNVVFGFQSNTHTINHIILIAKRFGIIAKQTGAGLFFQPTYFRLTI